jgi:hypothetical protein
MKRLTRASLVGLGASVLLTVSALSANAAPLTSHGVGPNPGLGSTATLQGASAGSITATPDVPISGGGVSCVGETDRPYYAASDIWGDAYTYCGDPVAEIYVQSEMYRSRWYGWQGLNIASDQEYHTTEAYDIVDAGVCGGQHNFLVDSYHEVMTSEQLTADTANQANNLNC